MTAVRQMRLWHGGDAVEAFAAYRRALDAEFSELRARIVGSIASWRDCWALQGTLAKFHNCSIRTVQRALHDAREKGFIRCAFSKPGERPPRARNDSKDSEPNAPLPFKWSHRWTIGRGLAGKALQAAINAARAAAVICKVVPKRTFNEPQRIAKAKAKLRNPPNHLSRDQRARWIEEQMELEPSALHLDEREPKPPD